MPFKIEDVKPRIRPTAKRQYIRYKIPTLEASKDGGASAGMGHGHGEAKGGAPSAAGGMMMDPNGTPFNMFLNGGFCTDCTILAAQLDVVFDNGTRADIANGVYLHHVTERYLVRASCPLGHR